MAHPRSEAPRQLQVLTMDDKLTLVWDLRHGLAYISVEASGPLAAQYQEWEGRFKTVLLAVKGAQEAGIPVTHRAVVDDSGKTGWPLRI